MHINLFDTGNSFNTDNRVLVIAEIGNNHEGSFDNAKKLVEKAAECGVDCVKFQTFKTEFYVSRENKERFNRLKSFELTFDQFAKLAELSRSLGLMFASTPFDLESARFLGEVADIIKIGSCENTFYPLLSEVAKTKKPIIMSCGLSDLKQVEFSKFYIENTWEEIGHQGEIALLHCITMYPTLAQHSNLGALTQMLSKFDCTIGYSDHTEGKEACLIAIAKGARIIEKHFTLDRNFSDFRDHQLSADPVLMKELVNNLREFEKYLVNLEEQRKIQQGEKEIEPLVRRSIVAKTDMKQGHIIVWEDLSWTRPSGGLPPGKEYLILGKTIKKDIKAGDRILLEDVS